MDPGARGDAAKVDQREHADQGDGFEARPNPWRGTGQGKRFGAFDETDQPEAVQPEEVVSEPLMAEEPCGQGGVCGCCLKRETWSRGE